jgi:microcin C transport system substrate-binding protein
MTILFLRLTALLIIPVLIPVTALGARAEHAIAMNGEPKYGPGFEHFDYVNPDAPKGGVLRQASIGTFDSLNPFIAKGNPADGLSLTYDTLTVKSADEPFTEYGLLAEKIETPEDRSRVIFHLRPEARWSDGEPVTAEDVIFSFNTLVEKGSPLYARYYADVSEAVALDQRRVRFTFGEEANRELPLILGQLTVFPKHYWKDRDFSKTTLTPPVTSGPYRIKEFDPGRSITYERDPDYWGKDLPVSTGFHNFAQRRFDYYRDAGVALTAFKSGEYDFRLENISKNWATAYVGPPFDQGLIIKETIEHNRPAGMQCFVMNQRDPLFTDRRVRLALAQAFDFEWTNEHLFYGMYERTDSYFENSELEAEGLPSEAELELLEPLREHLPPEVFTEEYSPPTAKGPGGLRANLRKALKLLREAGWEVRDGVLTHKETGAPFEFEILLYNSSFERVVLPFTRNLERLGIKANVRLVDTSQYINRIRDFEFDMIVNVFGQSLSPGNEQRWYWHSAAAEAPGTRNYCGIKNQAVDVLVGKVINAPDREALVTACRALDRALLWGHYVIPHWHSGVFNVAYWNKVEHPDEHPPYDLPLDAWWIDPDKAAKLPETP